MNGQHFRAFLWLRWRLRINQLKRAGTTNAIILGILLVIAVRISFDRKVDFCGVPDSCSYLTLAQTLSTRHAFQAAEKFQVLAADRSDHAIVRMHHSHQRSEFARMVCAHFQHRRLMAIFEFQQREWNAHIIVEAALTGQCDQTLI